MNIKEIVKSITDLENQLKEKDQVIEKLQKEITLLKSDNENTQQVLKETEERLKTTLTAILTNVKQGLNAPKKEEKQIKKG